MFQEVPETWPCQTAWPRSTTGDDATPRSLLQCHADGDHAHGSPDKPVVASCLGKGASCAVAASMTDPHRFSKGEWVRPFPRPSSDFSRTGARLTR